VTRPSSRARGADLDAPPLLRVPQPGPLLPGTLVSRYDRFLADVRLGDGRVVPVHCVNPGRMEGLVRPGARVWISRAPPGRPRRLAYTWELVEDGAGQLVGANTTVPNRLGRALLEARLLRGLGRWEELAAERATGGGSRVDFWLRRGQQETWVEVKNCHLVYPDGRGYFPDSVSVRATRHLAELTELVAAGHRSVVLFTVQRPDARAVRPSDAHDPTFAQAVRRAARAGVRFRAVRVRPTTAAYEILGTIPVDLRPYGVARRRAWRAANDPISGTEVRAMRRPRRPA